MTTKNAVVFSVNAVKSALEDLKIAPNSSKKAKLTVYSDWKDKNFTRGRLTYYLTDDKIESFFLHLSPDTVKIWLPTTSKGGPDHVISGKFT